MKLNNNLFEDNPIHTRLKKLSKDKILHDILTLVKNLKIKEAKNLIYVTRKIGNDYPELKLIEKSIGPAERLPYKAMQLPSYDIQTKHHKGSVIDWCEDNNITSDDIQIAMDNVRKSTLFKSIKEHGLIYNPNHSAEKNGTFYFNPINPINPRSFNYYKDPIKTYKIYANGQIRSTSSGIQYKLQSPKSIIVPNEPVQTLIATYMAAIKQLITKITK